MAVTIKKDCKFVNMWYKIVVFLRIASPVSYFSGSVKAPTWPSTSQLALITLNRVSMKGDSQLGWWIAKPILDQVYLELHNGEATLLCSYNRLCLKLCSLRIQVSDHRIVHAIKYFGAYLSCLCNFLITVALQIEDKWDTMN